MRIRMNFTLCALVFLICSSYIRVQSTSVPHVLASALNMSEVLTTTPTHNSTDSVSSNSSQPNSTLNTPLPQGPSASNTTVRIPPASTLQPTLQDNTTFPNLTATDLPVTTGNVGSSAPANSTTGGEITQSSGMNIQPTTKSHRISGPQPVTTTPSASVAHSSTPPPKYSPSNVPILHTTSSSLRTTSIATAKPHHDIPSELNVGDEDVPDASHNSGGPDPLLAGLVSVFILSAAIGSLFLFLKFRRRNDGPEFRRLQDLPMDDMMEDTPLSMFTY